MTRFAPSSLALFLTASLCLGAWSASAPPAAAQQGAPLEITVAGGEFRPIALAVPPLATAGGVAPALAREIAAVVEANLTGSGLFRVVASPGAPTGLDAPLELTALAGAGVEAVVVGDVAPAEDGRAEVRFRLFDTATGEQLEGLRILVDQGAVRRAGHKISDAVYAALTGDGGYFDTRIVFVDETGGKGARVKRLAIMDQDGANLRWLSSGRDLVLTPRFSPVAQEILYVSYETGEPQVFLYNLETNQREALGAFPGMTIAPRFSPDGQQVALSMSEAGNTDIYVVDLATQRRRRLTRGPSIDTSPSFSPDGGSIVFESDRGEGQQIYVMTVAGGEETARRISFGDGRYATPVWSPRGDLIAFTKIGGGRFQIGVMRPDGSEERVLDSAFHSEGPSWAPNGRVLAFFRETAGAGAEASIWRVDVSGVALRRIATPNHASDPAWSPLLP